VRLRSVAGGLISLLAFAGLTTYTGLVGVLGSDAVIHPHPHDDCRTPLEWHGWAYEAINYNIADDLPLRARNSNMEHCVSQGEKAGNEVVTSDGIRIGGWYIPASDGVGPTGTTVVLIHGWNDNKSQVLEYAWPFHDRFNVVAFDLRNGGRSTGDVTTFGIGEKLDVGAIVDWLERTKHPAHIAVMGNSMGGATSLLAAAGDPRIEAVILDSTHAHFIDVLADSLQVDRGLPSLPGAPAILAAIWLHTGLDFQEADPSSSVSALGRRPLLILHGSADANDLPDQSAAVIDATAKASGVPVELDMCPGATHARVIDVCPWSWAHWSVDFLDRTVGER
jgi:fermentation-respiration switch protein FrsA (DUF1100 family)